MKNNAKTAHLRSLEYVANGGMEMFDAGFLPDIKIKTNALLKLLFSNNNVLPNGLSRDYFGANGIWLYHLNLTRLYICFAKSS